MATRRLSGPRSVNSIQPTLSVAKSNRATKSSITSRPRFVPSQVDRSMPPSLPLMRMEGRKSPPLPMLRPKPIIILSFLRFALCAGIWPPAGPSRSSGISDAEHVERVLTRAWVGEVKAVGVDGDQARQFVWIGGDGEEVLQRTRHAGQGCDVG